MTPSPYDPGAEIMKIRWFFKKEMKPSKITSKIFWPFIQTASLALLKRSWSMPAEVLDFYFILNRNCGKL